MTDASPAPGRVLTPARLVMTAFFIQGAVLSNWFPRIPDVQAALGVGPAQLSLGLVGMPVGIFAALLVAGRVVAAMTPRRVVVIGGAIYCLAMSLPGWAWSIAGLFVGLLLLGGVFSTIDVAINVEAAAIQRRIGRRILSTTHGFWSLGAMVGAVVGAGFAQYGVPVHWHLLAIGLLALVPIVAIGRALPFVPAATVLEVEPGPPLTLPSRAMIGLALFGFGMILTEIATRTWAAVFMRDAIAASPAETGIGYGVFSLMMAVGRFFGDRGAERFGPVALTRAGAVAAVVGIVAVALAPNVTVAIVGLAALGAGISVGYPLAVSAAADRADRSPSINVASLALVAFTGSLVGPPLVGFVAEDAGFRAGMATLLPILIVSALLTGRLARQPQPLDEADPRG